MPRLSPAGPLGVTTSAIATELLCVGWGEMMTAFFARMASGFEEARGCGLSHSPAFRKCAYGVPIPKLSLTPLPLIRVPRTMENREDSNYRSIELVEDGIRKSSYDRPAIVFINRDTFSDSVQDRAYLLQSSPRILLLALAGDSHTIHKRVQDHLWLPPQSELQRARRFRT